MPKKYFLIIMLCFTFWWSSVFWFTINWVNSFKESIVFDYMQDFVNNGYMPWDTTNTLINSNYPSVSLYMRQTDLWYLLNNKEDWEDVDVFWFVSWNLKREFVRKFKSESFFWKVWLRWVTSLTCAKPSFSVDVNWLKLKSMCWSDYGVEEQLFSRWMDALFKKMNYSLDSSHAFWSSHHLYNLFINNEFYGVYEKVPNLNKEFLESNGLVNVNSKNSCILKIYKLITKNNNSDWFPILTTLETISHDFDYLDVAFMSDLKYWNDNCFYQFSHLISFLNNSTMWDLWSIWKLIDKKSVLFWWIANIVWNTMLSFEHNYLIAINNWKFYIWFWDNEAFRWCVNDDISGYWNQPHQNLLFSYVLKWYEENDPDQISQMLKLVKDHLCSKELFTDFKENHLQYVLYDRYLRNIGHFSTLDNRDRGANAYLYDVYYGLLDFDSYIDKMNRLFDEFFYSIP